MLIAEYSYEEDIRVKQQEAEQQGLQQGLQVGLHRGMILTGEIFQTVKKNPDLTNEKIAERVGCNEEEVENVRKMFDI